jgi:hypothetical protein
MQCACKAQADWHTEAAAASGNSNSSDHAVCQKEYNTEDLTLPSLLHSRACSAVNSFNETQVTPPEPQTLSRTAIMEKPARSTDQRNATDRASASELAAHEFQQDQLTDSIRHRDQFVAVPEQPTLHERPVDPAEQPKQDGDNTGAATLSMEETLKRYIPDDSDMARSIKQQKTQVWSIAEDDHWWHEGELNLDRLRKLQVQSTEGYIVLFIQDSNLDWCKALCAEYPGVLSPEDLAEHVIRFDGLPSTHLEWDPRGIGEKLGSLYPTAKIRVQPSGNPCVLK